MSAEKASSERVANAVNSRPSSSSSSLPQALAPSPLPTGDSRENPATHQSTTSSSQGIGAKSDSAEAGARTNVNVSSFAYSSDMSLDSSESSASDPVSVTDSDADSIAPSTHAMVLPASRDGRSSADGSVTGVNAAVGHEAHAEATATEGSVHLLLSEAGGSSRADGAQAGAHTTTDLGQIPMQRDESKGAASAASADSDSYQPDSPFLHEPDYRSNVYVGNLADGVTEATLRQLFAPYGHIVRCKVAKSRTTSEPAGHGFVQYDNIDAANKAIAELNNIAVHGKNLKVSIANPPVNIRSNTNLYVCSLPPAFTQEDLELLFSRFGVIIAARLLTHAGTGVSRGVGFVRYETPSQAYKAISALHGHRPLGATEPMIVKLARDKHSRSMDEAEAAAITQGLAAMGFHTSEYGDPMAVYAGHDGVPAVPYDPAYPPYSPPSPPLVQGGVGGGGREPRERPKTNLYISGLPLQFMRAELEQLFGRFGRIIGCRVLTQENGVSRGIGFVRFDNHQASLNAIQAMNGQVPAGFTQPISVKFARESAKDVARQQAVHSNHTQRTVINNNNSSNNHSHNPHPHVGTYPPNAYFVPQHPLPQPPQQAFPYPGMIPAMGPVRVVPAYPPQSPPLMMAYPPGTVRYMQRVPVQIAFHPSSGVPMQGYYPLPPHATVPEYAVPQQQQQQQPMYWQAPAEQHNNNSTAADASQSL